METGVVDRQAHCSGSGSCKRSDYGFDEGVGEGTGDGEAPPHVASSINPVNPGYVNPEPVGSDMVAGQR